MFGARVAATLATLLIAATACSAGPGSGRSAVAAFYPLAWVTDQVAGDQFEVTNLTSPGGEPHDLELSIRQMADVAGAEVIVFERGFQPSVEDAVDKQASGRVVDAAEVVDLQPFQDHAETGHAHEEHTSSDAHDHGEMDPHFWLDPIRMADLGDAIAVALADVDPDHAADFERRAGRLRTTLEELDAEYAAGLASCVRDTLVVTHDAFNYLSKYDLHVEPILGISPEAEPTAAVLAQLKALIRTEGITTVFTETLASPRVANALAREAGVRTAVLDPVEGLGSSTADEDYLSLMRTNLRTIQEANDCG